MRLVLAMVAAACVLAASAPRAAAQTGDLARAMKAIDELDYDAAWKSLGRALESGERTADELVLIYQLTGRVAAAFGNGGEARRAFARMLAIDPTAELAPGQAPKVTRPFARARRLVDQRGSLLVDFEAIEDKTGWVAIVIVNDPLGMVAGARVSYDDRVVDTEGKARIEVPIEPTPSAQVVLAAIDEHGNQLVQTFWEVTAVATPGAGEADTSADAAPLVASARDVEPAVAERTSERERIDLVTSGDGRDDRRSRKPLLRRWWVWGTAAAASAATAIYYGVRATRDWERLDRTIEDSTMYTYGEARAIERSGRRNSRISNATAGLAAGFGVVAGYFLYASFDF